MSEYIQSKNYNDLKVRNIQKLKIDVIVEYQLKNEEICTVPILANFIQGENQISKEAPLTKLLKYYLASKEDLQILNIYEYNKKYYGKSDFNIQVLGISKNQELIFVNITNKVTGVILNDWIRPFQLKSSKELNELICWESSGKKLRFNLNP